MVHMDLDRTGKELVPHTLMMHQTRTNGRARASFVRKRFKCPKDEGVPDEPTSRPLPSGRLFRCCVHDAEQSTSGRSILPRPGSNAAPSGSDRERPSVGRIRSTLGATQPKLGQRRPKSGRGRPGVGREVGPIWVRARRNLGFRVRPKIGRCQKLVDIGTASVQTWPSPSPSRPTPDLRALFRHMLPPSFRKDHNTLLAQRSKKMLLLTQRCGPTLAGIGSKCVNVAGQS